jgi:hypothetical protein
MERCRCHSRQTAVYLAQGSWVGILHSEIDFDPGSDSSLDSGMDIVTYSVDYSNTLD